MATVITGRNYEVTPDIRALVEKKLARIQDRLFDDVIEARCMLQVEKYRNICEILIVGKEHDVKAVQESDESMQDAVNAAIDHLKRQAQKNRKKIRDHHRKDGNHVKAAVTEWAVQVLEPGRLRETGDHNRPRIIKTNNLPIRPMSIEEAALRLEDSKNEFIVFRDLDTEKISVIYKRRDNNLGLIAPEI
ncbi:MAG TPA: ribosome-associated translation inhibitor RaiA [Thermoanaerobaculia bacterium]|nr:ribosome-associated translation inhibitor RaiA [Thermoanaerobaculia bacterium]